MRSDTRPDDAWWDAKDQEWVHGARDEAGRLVGEVRYWNEAGVLISTAEHVAGKPHGIARRYYPNGEVAQECRYVDGVLDGVHAFLRPRGDVELPRQLADCDEDVVAYECVYERGDLIGTRWRDRDGREVDQHGRPVRARPPGVAPTASHIQGQGWFFLRRRGEDGDQILETREYYESGELREVSTYADGKERSFYRNGQLRHEGQRDRTGQRHYEIGTWRYYDAKGGLRLVSEYGDGTEVRRTWHRPASEGKRGGVTREGPIDRDSEVGVWTVRDAGGSTIAELDLGPRMTDADLLAHAVTADELDDASAPADRDRSIVAMIARARRAGRAKDIKIVGLARARAWRLLDEDTGKTCPLAKQLRYERRLVGLVHALRWGPPDGELLADIAAYLFRGDRAQAALDVIDAALLLGDDPAWVTARVAYLRATGRAAEAGALVAHAHPGRLDARALELLDEIRQHPDDDGPRLVFADHVANVFPEHTAVIVAQCSGAPTDDLVRAFVATLPEWLRYEPTRGFVDGPLYVPAEHFVTGDPDVLYRVAPTCRTLNLRDASGFVAQLVTMPALRRYANLSFTDTYLFGGGAEQLARCKHLEHLEHLGLYATSMDDDDLLAIVRSTAYPRLHGLEIGNSREEQDYSLAAFQALADAVFAPTLRMLGFAKRWFGDDAVEVLAKLPALVQLDMASAALTDHGAAELAELPCRLTSLDLHHNDIGLAGARALAASPVLAELTRLELASNPLGDAGAAAIATSPRMAKLASLSLSGGFDDRVGPAAAEALAGGTIARSLEMLNLSLARISTAGAQALARGTFPRLQHLDLYGNQIGDPGLVALARAPFISQLRGLNLGDNQIGSTGAAALCDADTHPELFVELGGAEVSEAVKRRLAERFGDRVKLEHPWNRLR